MHHAELGAGADEVEEHVQRRHERQRLLGDAELGGQDAEAGQGAPGHGGRRDGEDRAGEPQDEKPDRVHHRAVALGGVFAPKSSAPGGAGGSGAALAGTYTTTFTGAEGNVDLVQDYQFQCADLLGLMNYDSRLTLTLSLTLNADGTYALFSDAYCIDAGKRAVIGDETGLGIESVRNCLVQYTGGIDRGTMG